MRGGKGDVSLGVIILAENYHRELIHLFQFVEVGVNFSASVDSQAASLGEVILRVNY